MATINDVAEMAGVSAATVSHVVNKTRYVSPELEKRVMDVINTLEFPPNFVVKKTKSNSAEHPSTLRCIALIVSDSQSRFQSSLEKEINRYAMEAGYSLLTLDYGKDRKLIEMFSQLIISFPNICGIIALLDSKDNALDKFIARSKIPMVLIGKSVKQCNADVIISDNFGGAYKATAHLIRSGHERIAILSGDDDYECNLDRINGYKKALEDNNIAANTQDIISGLTTEEAINKALKAIFLNKQSPTAVFAANYNIMLSILHFINLNNIECPDNLSIVSFNDFEWSSLYKPAITTVAQNVKKISQLATSQLFKKIEEAEKGTANHVGQVFTIPTELRVRSSTSGIGRGPFGEKAASADVLQLSDEDIRTLKSKKYTAAISFHYSGKSWMHLHEQGIKDVFNSLGISLIATTDAHFDPILQNKQLESLLMMEPDILISIPTDTEKTSATFKKIVSSKTKLVLITNIPEGLNPKDYVTCVSVNERSHGRNAGYGLGEYMTKFNLSNYGTIRHKQSFYATNQRDNAAEQILAEEYPDLKLCGTVYFDKEEAVYDKAIELMTQHPEINGLYVSWEGPAAKVLKALTDIERTDVIISTADLEYPLALNMAKGGMLKAISSQCPYEQGQAMALAAANALLEKPVPSFIGVEPIYITSDNLLKSWKKVYKEEPSPQLISALNENPNYFIEQS